MMQQLLHNVLFQMSEILLFDIFEPCYGMSTGGVYPSLYGGYKCAAPIKKMKSRPKRKHLLQLQKHFGGYFHFPFTHLLHCIYLSMICYKKLSDDGNRLTLWRKICLSQCLALVV